MAINSRKSAMNRLEQQVHFLCSRYRIDARKSLGQHFVIDEKVLSDMVSAAEIGSDDHILEIGPGIGTLTFRILEKTPHVTAIETDRIFEPILKKIQSLYPRFQYRIEDARRTRLEEIAEHKEYSVVSNLPYQITSQFFRQCWDGELKPKRMTVMIQKEVAERVTAVPGKMNLLALSVQMFAIPCWIRDVPSSAFSPRPDVESAIIRLDRRAHPAGQDPDAVFRIARMGFAGKRKQLHNSLANGLHCSSVQAKQYLQQAGIPMRTRPQELSIQNWQQLSEVINVTKGFNPS